MEARWPEIRDLLGEIIEPEYDPLFAVHEWLVVDLTAPETSLDWGPPAETGNTRAVFGATSHDPTATLECSLDLEGFSGCETPIEYADLLEGPHMLQVRAVDESHNADPSPEV